ncbi:MAG: hypothetical protein ACYS29_10980 [Planctomycetota bacterium]
MATQAQINANRRNAKRSTGPRTPRGKAAISNNALKHGLFARQTLISSEDPNEFLHHRRRILAELLPQGPMEFMLAERIISLAWRLKRADRLQSQAIDVLNKDHTPDPSTEPDQSNTDPEPPQNDLHLGHIAVEDFSGTRVLDRLLRYERRIEHSLYRTVLELKTARIMRKKLHYEGPDQETEHLLLLGR